MRDPDFIKKVGSIVQSGCHDPPCKSAGCLNFPCDGAYPINIDKLVTDTYRTFIQLELWDLFPQSLGGTNAPSPSPTECQANCTSTETPTMSPLSPTISPTDSPVIIPTDIPSESPTRAIEPRIALFEDITRHLNLRRDEIESQVFVSESDSGYVPSKLYTLDGFINNLRSLAIEGVDDMMFYIGQDGNFDMGLANIALFLAHAMTRGILWDSCEEINHHKTSDGKLPLSNACGQHGKTYTDDICPLADAAMECAVDRSMNIEQASVGNSGAPKFFCGPTSTYPFTGFYDPYFGSTVSSPTANAAGRTDVEACCFWGRGILFNQGLCDIGRFNHFYGLPAIMDERLSGRYNIDFCLNPEAVCTDFTIPTTQFSKFPITVDTSEARYLMGFLYWMSQVQNYNWGYFNFMEGLKLFVKGGRKDFSFVDRFSDIVLDSKRDSAARKANFRKVLEILFMKIETASPTSMETPPPTPRPTPGPRTPPPTLPGGNSVGNSVGQGSATGIIEYPQIDIAASNSSNPNLQNVSNATSTATSNTNQQPAPTPGRPNGPVTFDLTAPKPISTLPSVTVVDFPNISFGRNRAQWSSIFIFSCTLLLL